MMNAAPGETDRGTVLVQLGELTKQWRTGVFGLAEDMLPESLPLEARPLSQGLRLVAEDPLPPGQAYRRFVEWARPRGYLGFASTYEDPTDLLRSWLPRWRKGLYVSTSITSGGAALDPALSMPEVIAQNTRLAEQLTNQIIADHEFDPRDVLLSTDLPNVKGWKQSDYMIFWLLNMDGVPVDVCEPIARELQIRAEHSGMDRKDLDYEAKWFRYRLLIEDFFELADRYRLHSRNDYYQQVAGIRQLVQLVDTGRSLGSRAEELYARRHGMEVLTFELNRNSLPRELGRTIGELTALGAQIGRPADERATRLVRS